MSDQCVLFYLFQRSIAFLAVITLQIGGGVCVCVGGGGGGGGFGELS